MITLYYVISSLVTGIISGTLAFIVLWKKRHSEIAKVFFLMSMTLSLYLLFYSLFPLFNSSKEYSLIIFRLISVPAIFIGITFFHFFVVYTNNKEKYGKIVLLGYVLSVVFLFFVNTKFFIIDMVPKFGWSYWGVPGIVHHFFVLLMFFFFSFGIYILYKEYLICDLVKKSQIRLFFIGVVVLTFSGSTNFFYWYNINIPPVTMPLMIVFPLLVAYSIIAHHLFDIKIVLRKSVVYSFSIGTVAFFLLPFKLLSIRYFNDSVSIIDFILLLLALGIYQPVKEYYYNFANKYFFTSLYNSQELISSLSKSLRSTLETDKIYKDVSYTIGKYLHSRSISFLTYNKSKKLFDIKFNDGFSFGRKQKISFSKLFFEKEIEKSSLSLTDMYSKNNSDVYYNRDVEFLEEINCSILVPLHIQGKVIGMILIGPKESKEAFNADDIEVLEILGGIIATTLSNAYLFNSLEKKKEDLEELLNIKTKFLKIINHQLNTPLSKINIGLYAMNEKMVSNKKAIEVITDGANQMNSFLTDYWNSFEFEGGKKKNMNFSNFDIFKLAKEVVREKKQWDFFKKSKLKLELQKPLMKTTVRGDIVFIRQTLSILIENAIYYTKEGGLKIYFEEIKKNGASLIKMFFEDTGLGINKDAKHFLFKKFSRGPEASLSYPDGAGLDLYLAKKIIEANFGELKLEKSIVGKGSIFSITIPKK